MHPNLRSDLPLYPPLLQLVRVGATTVPGPSGYSSSSFLGPSLYVGAVQQLRTDTIMPRDREPCLALDVNGTGLAPGYYLGRLAGSHNALPVYEVVGSAIPLVGLTPEQLTAISLYLTPLQITKLNNINACQLQTFLTLTIPQQQIITGSMTATQIGILVGTLTTTQLQNIISTLNVSQLQIMTNTITAENIKDIITVLTAAQVQSLVVNLTSTQLVKLVNYPPLTVGYLVGALSIANLQTLINAAAYMPLVEGALSTGKLTMVNSKGLLVDSPLSSTGGLGLDLAAAVPLTISLGSSAAAFITDGMMQANSGYKIGGTQIFFADGAYAPPAIADAAAQNGTEYYSTDRSKIVFKDFTGTVNEYY